MPGKPEELSAERWLRRSAGPGSNGEADFRGHKCSNETHASTTDPDARLFKKSAGQASRLCHMGHMPMENRNGLVVEAVLTQATGKVEREAACEMVGSFAVRHRVTLGADKAYDTGDFVAEMRRLGVTPHVSQNNEGRRSAIAVSVRVHKRIEEVFGWMKSSAGFRKTRHRGTDRVGWMLTLNAAAYNLVRLPKLLAPRPNQARNLF
jgi:hypothetical protein